MPIDAIMFYVWECGKRIVYICFFNAVNTIHHYNIYIAKSLYNKLECENKIVLCSIQGLQKHGIFYNERSKQWNSMNKDICIDSYISIKGSIAISYPVGKKWKNIKELMSRKSFTNVHSLKNFSDISPSDPVWYSRVQLQLTQNSTSNSVYNSHSNANNKPEEENGVKVRGRKAEKR